MSIFKCKMCGGTIEFEQGATVGVCDSCGTKQTLPKTHDDNVANLFNRANNLRLKSEFDKAEQIYEKIVQLDDSEAEAHWGIVLCKYGIEYVEDPKTFTRIPTCHRTCYDAVTSDPDYQAAIDYSDAGQQAIYESEARAIDRIQKDILAIVAKEEPFDVFICYKETDENGKRTIDSTIANDIYYQLTQEGFKVFYAAITLEDKLGREYEPYIFAALHSAKVMLVIGTKPEYYNAVWVKNEWSRYLKLMKEDRSKLLIPCYRDMDAYDLPEEFAHLQAQDMSKIGFINDVVRGIKKVISVDAPVTVNETVVVNNASSSNTASFLERAFIFLEDGKWQDANIYCEKVLDIDPKNAEAYLGKLMAELKVTNRKSLGDCAQPFDDRDNFNKVIRFGNDELENEMRGYIAHINERNENERLTGIYNGAVNAMNAAKTESAFKTAAKAFESIKGFKDADCLAEQCLNEAENCRKDVIYTSAKSRMIGENAVFYEEAIKTFQTISGWKDSNDQIQLCLKRIEEIKANEEALRLEAARRAEEQRIAAEKAAKRRKTIAAILIPSVAVVIAFVIVLVTVIIPKQKFSKAMDMLDSGDYEGAYALLEELGNTEAIASSKYDRAMKLIDSGDYDSAYVLLEEIGNNGAIASSKYDRAMKLIDSGDYEGAIILLNGLTFKDSEDKAAECLYIMQKPNLSDIKKGDTIKFGFYEQDNNTTNGKEEIEWIVRNVEGSKALVISKYALDCQPYNTTRMNVTWEECSLRKWLNDSFLNTAFGSKHQELIISGYVSADENPNCRTNPGNATTDKVFLLSITEAKKYFTSGTVRQCKPTKYAVANGAYVNGDNGNCWWWLRSPGLSQSYAADVYHDGSVTDNGSDVSNDRGCVRPALWINLES